MSAASSRGVSQGAANCNGVPWGEWRWTPERVVALLVVVSLVAQAHDGRSREGLRLVAWVLLGHGASAAWRLLTLMDARGCGGREVFHCGRMALASVGALDWMGAARIGRVGVVGRVDVLRAGWYALRASGASREVCAHELGELVGAWAPRDAHAWVAAQVEAWK